MLEPIMSWREKLFENIDTHSGRSRATIDPAGTNERISSKIVFYNTKWQIVQQPVDRNNVRGCVVIWKIQLKTNVDGQ